MRQAVHKKLHLKKLNRLRVVYDQLGMDKSSTPKPSALGSIEGVQSMVSIRATAHQESFMAQTIALICVVVLMLAVSGCKPGVADRFNQAELAFLIKGKTSQQDAIAKLGQPSTSSLSHIGIHQMSWRYDKAAVDGKTPLPFAGTLIGKGTAEPKVISAEFDQHGMLVSYEWRSGTDELTNAVPKP